MSITLKLPPIVEYQQRALFGKERIAVVEGSTKCGKTYPCILWLLDQACRNGLDGRAFWWVAPIYEQAKIAYRRTVGMMRQADPDKRVWKTNEQEMTVTLEGRGRLYFKSADKPDSLYGEDVFAAVIDEASRCKEQSWYAVRSTLTATGGPIRIIGNVRGRKNWAYRMARRAEGGDPGMSYAKITCADAVAAGIIPPEEVEQAKRDLPEWVFKELYLSEPSEDGANPFGMQHIASCVGPLSDGEPKWFGVDLAKSSDWTVVIGLDSRGSVCVFDRWQRVPWKETQARILSHVRSLPALIDSTGVGDPIVEGLARDCPGVEGRKFTNQSKQQLMEGLAVAIQSVGVEYPDGLIRDELEEFEFAITPSGRVSYSAPEGCHDDCVCALALAVQCRSLNMGELSLQVGSRSVSPGYGKSDDELMVAARAEHEERIGRFFRGQ